VTNLGDLRAIDWAAVEPVDVLTARFPCQDIFNAGNGPGSPEPTAACGPPSPTLFAFYDHESCSWRTSPPSSDALAFDVIAKAGEGGPRSRGLPSLNGP
jgi:hypothetical protein